MKKIILLFVLIFTLSGCTSKDEEQAPDILLNGTSIVSVAIDEEFEDPGAYINEEGYTITVSGTVDTTTLGEYVVTYSYEYEGETISINRTVNVVSPTIIQFYLLGSEEISIDLGENYTDAGVYISNTTIEITATNDIDWNTPGTYSIVFSITVNEQTVALGGTYTDLGYTINDTTITVNTSSDVDVNVVGTYHVTYSYNDNGNPVIIIRTVIVE